MNLAIRRLLAVRDAARDCGDLNLARNAELELARLGYREDPADAGMLETADLPRRPGRPRKVVDG